MSYIIHNVCGVSHETSIAIIGKISGQESKILKKIDFDFSRGGWPSELDEKDQELNKLFPVNLEEAVKKDNFVMFGYPDLEAKKTMKDLILARFPKLEPNGLSLGAFSAYFAHIHSDKDMYSRGQINIILENKLGHSLISRSEDGEYHCIVPEKGDIIFLDIHCEHAVIPNQSEGFAKMRKYPMISAMVSYDL